MIYYNNLAQTKQAIQHYVEAGDYSRPHIVAVEMCYCPELTAVLSKNIKMPDGKDLRYIGWTDPSFAGLAGFLNHYTENYVVIKLGGRPEYSHPNEELNAVLSQPVKATRPWFIYMESSTIRKWIDELHTDCDINFYAFDKDEWLKAGETINPTTGRRVIDRFYLDFLKQAPDDFILFHPQEKHSGMTCNLPSKWIYASSNLYNELRRSLVVAAKANGNKDKKREEIVQMVKPTLDSVFENGDIDWSRLADILETFPEDVWQTCCILPNRYKATAATLSRVDCFKMVAVSLVDCVTPNVYDALLEFHGLPAIP